jgi:hypothetical protein
MSRVLLHRARRLPIGLAGAPAGCGSRRLRQGAAVRCPGLRTVRLRGALPRTRSCGGPLLRGLLSLRRRASRSPASPRTWRRRGDRAPSRGVAARTVRPRRASRRARGEPAWSAHGSSSPGRGRGLPLGCGCGSSPPGRGRGLPSGRGRGSFPSERGRGLPPGCGCGSSPPGRGWARPGRGRTRARRRRAARSLAWIGAGGWGCRSLTWSVGEARGPDARPAQPVGADPRGVDRRDLRGA